jgi:pilus assembly protein Flp/PilA
MKSWKVLTRFLESEDGPTTVEYAVMLALIVGVCLGAIQSLTQATEGSFRSSADAIDSALNP